MENLLFPPEKVKKAVFDQNRQPGESFIMRYFIVIDAKTGKPQNFCSVVHDEDIPVCGFGIFIDADMGLDENTPAEIYDRETALYLIGQDAIYRSLDPLRLRDQEVDAPIFRLVPVFGTMIYDCVTKVPNSSSENPAQ